MAAPTPIIGSGAAGSGPALSLVAQINELKTSIHTLREASTKITTAYEETRTRIANLEKKVG